MTIKFTALFQLATNVSSPNAQPRRIGGWSESWYFPGTSISACLAEATGAGSFGGAGGVGWLGTRADLLGVGAAIVGQRFQQVNPAGPTQSLSLLYPGSSTLLSDIPQMALLSRVPALNANNIRRMVLRGIPDARVVEGEYAGSQDYDRALKNFFKELAAWQFRGRDLSQAAIKVVSISAVGAFQTETPHGFNPGDIVRVLRSRTVDGDLIGGRFVVATIGPTNSTGTMTNWGTEATTGGTMRKDAIVFVNVDSANVSVGRVITRRVGRPFIQYRGRRSRKTL